MPIYKLKLTNKTTVANSTCLFTFEKPEGFNFKPGQYGGFTLINPPSMDPQNLTRRFSILSTPEDTDIQIAMRISNSGYKTFLNSLPMGSEIKFAGPTGTFTLHDDAHTPAVLIAGGIGITPFYSMIRHACAVKSPQQIYLFYGNQTKQDSAFLDELEQLTQANPNFKLIAAMAAETNDWTGETGYIDSTMLQTHLPNLDTPIFYVCGSPAMVAALQATLTEMEINPERIKVEDFPGY